MWDGVTTSVSHQNETCQTLSYMDMILLESLDVAKAIGGCDCWAEHCCAQPFEIFNTLYLDNGNN